MRSKILLAVLALLPLACSGSVEATGERRATQTPVDECEFEATEACTADGRAGERTCVPGEQGYVWSECRAIGRDTSRDQCTPGEVKQCQTYGAANTTTTCELIDGRYAFPPNACSTPLVLAFDDEPVEFTQAAGQFDLSGRGLSIATDWVSAKTPWLAVDLDHNGAIDDGRELFGSMTVLANGQRATNGFEALAPLDADGDGWITRRDPGFAELRVWRDTNQDRRSSRSELGSVAEAGLVSIELRNHVVPRCCASGCEMERARFTFRDANARLRQGSVIDVHLVER
jgi:hypothetical protein